MKRKTALASAEGASEKICGFRSRINKKTLGFRLSSPRYLKVHLTHGFTIVAILSAPPAYESKQTFASAEGASEENLSDFDGKFLALIPSLLKVC